MSTLGHWLKKNEDCLIDRIQQHADATSLDATPHETWRSTVKKITRAIAEAEKQTRAIRPLHYGTQCLQDKTAAFGRAEAQRHYDRGQPGTPAFARLKYCRQGYLDLIGTQSTSSEPIHSQTLTVNQFFDSVELAFFDEWTRLSACSPDAECTKHNRQSLQGHDQLLSVFEDLSTPVLLLDHDKNVQYANRSAMRMWGDTDDNKPGPAQKSCGPLQLPQAISQAMHEASGHPHLLPKTEEVHIVQDGAPAHYQLEITPFYGSNRHCSGTLLLAHNISHFHQTLQESELQYRCLFENSHTTMLIINPENGQIEDANQAAVHFYGYSHEELVNKRIFEINNLSNTKIKKAMKQVLHENPEPLQFTHQLKNGELRQVEVFSGPIQRQGQAFLYSIIHDVTDRRSAESALKDSEEKFRSLMKQSPLAIMMFDTDGTLIEVNRAWETLWDISRTNLDLRQYNILEDEQAEGIGYQDGFKKALKGESIFIPQAEFVPERSGRIGRRRILSARFYPLKNGAGQINNIVVLANDITDRVTAQEALKKSEARYRLLAENITDVIWTMDINLRFTYVSPSVERLRGYTPQEVMQQPLEQVLTPESMHIVQTAMQHFLQATAQGLKTEKHLRYELEQPCKNGGTVWTEVDAVPIYDTEGRPQFFLGVSRDIDLRKKTQEQLAQLAAVVNQATESIIITDLKGTIRYANPHTAMASGYTLEQLIGANARLFKSNHHGSTFHKSIWQTILSGETWRGTLVNRKQDGSLYHEHAVIFPIKDAQGKILQLAAVKRDISELMLANEALHEAKELAEAASQAKGAFLANISHEIRTPLNAIMGFTEILTQRLQTAENLGFVKNIHSAGQNLLSLINDILDLSRIESEYLELKKVPCDLPHLLLTLRDIFSWKLVDKPIHYSHHWENTLPALLLLDENRLRQMLTNLIGNAVKFTERGEIAVSVSHNQVTPDTVDLRISVTDTGIGIKKNQQQKIFEPFRQAIGQDAAKYGGTGLGLAITRKLARRMGGDIALQSQWGEGTTFTICLSSVQIIHDTVPQMPRPVPAFPSAPDKASADEALTATPALETLLTEIERHHRPRWQHMKKSMIINDVLSFARAIETLAQKHQADPLVAWSQQLHSQAQVFDMTQLPRTMQEFPNIIQRLVQTPPEPNAINDEKPHETTKKQ